MCMCVSTCVRDILEEKEKDRERERDRERGRKEVKDSTVPWSSTVQDFEIDRNFREDSGQRVKRRKRKLSTNTKMKNKIK